MRSGVSVCVVIGYGLHDGEVVRASTCRAPPSSAEF